MKKSHAGEAATPSLLRNYALIFPLLLAWSATAVSAQQYSLVGQWRGVYQGITITIAIQANGQYSQLAQSAAGMTQQSGLYRLVIPNSIVFEVTNWAPKTMQVYHAVGTQRGYYTSEPTTKPPGADDTYVFNGPNTLVLTDKIVHGSITMTRVQ